MELEIWKQPKTEPPVTRLAWYTTSGGGICVHAVDKDGKTIPSGRLLTFDSSGTVFLHPDINPDLGFALDNEGQITIIDV